MPGDQWWPWIIDDPGWQLCCEIDYRLKTWIEKFLEKEHISLWHILKVMRQAKTISGSGPHCKTPEHKPRLCTKHTHTLTHIHIYIYIYIYIFNSIGVLPIVYYSWKPTLILYPLFCTICFVYASAHHPFLLICFFAYLRIHVNSMAAFNASYFLNSKTWHMISLIGHQRILTSVILKRLTP